MFRQGHVVPRAFSAESLNAYSAWSSSAATASARSSSAWSASAAVLFRPVLFRPVPFRPVHFRHWQRSNRGRGAPRAAEPALGGTSARRNQA
eukprot:7252878-Pyramimonas_sp.AAC.1